MLHRISFPPACCSFLFSVISLPNAALERYSTFEKFSRIFRQPSSSTRLKSCSPMIWMFCSSRIFRSTKLTTVTSPMCSTSRRRRRAGDVILHSLGANQPFQSASTRQRRDWPTICEEQFLDRRDPGELVKHFPSGITLVPVHVGKSSRLSRRLPRHGPPAQQRLHLLQR